MAPGSARPRLPRRYPAAFPSVLLGVRPVPASRAGSSVEERAPARDSVLRGLGIGVRSGPGILRVRAPALGSVPLSARLRGRINVVQRAQSDFAAICRSLYATGSQACARCEQSVHGQNQRVVSLHVSLPLVCLTT